jgi:sec-independent protein translocase protein TatA
MGAFFQGDELLIILVILLLILGPTKLPALARGLGQAVREFRKASSGLYDEETQSNLKLLSAERSARLEAPAATTTQATSKVDDETLLKLAEKLGVSVEGKSRDQIVDEIIAKAKEKKLL